ncbi:unnamed protein product, partial [marine sediment metagenome]
YREQFPEFLILWVMSGSGIYKSYPDAPEVCREIVESYPHVGIMLVGDKLCRILASDTLYEHPRIYDKCDIPKLRTTLLMTKYADLVVSPDTGILHAAGCFKTPKIVLYGHSMHENISKHFYNVIPIQSPAFCSPCCRLVPIEDYIYMCKPDRESHASLCMREIKKETVMDAVNSVVKGTAVYAS